MGKVAVINRTNLINYGSVLQSYALCESVRKLGYDSEILWEEGNLSKNFDFRPVKIFKTLLKIATHPVLIKSTLKNIKEVKQKPIDPKVVELFRNFVKNTVPQRTVSHKELCTLAKSEEYLKFICGSDQVWCSTTTYVDPLMYLRFAPKKKRVAYAPSIGRDYIPNYNKRQMKKYISEIPSVSVREDDGHKLIKELTGRDVPVVSDPTLLMERSFWENLENLNITIKKPYVLCYFLDTPSEETQKKIYEFAKKNNLCINALSASLDSIEDEDLISYPLCGPNEFISYVKNADVTITDSYHGMLFSMIFERKFWSVERAYQQFDQSSRQHTVLNRLNLMNRYLKDDISFNLDEIDYVKVNKILNDWKKESIEYLRFAIES